MHVREEFTGHMEVPFQTERVTTGLSWGLGLTE